MLQNGAGTFMAIQVLPRLYVSDRGTGKGTSGVAAPGVFGEMELREGDSNAAQQGGGTGTTGGGYRQDEATEDRPGTGDRMRSAATRAFGEAREQRYIKERYDNGSSGLKLLPCPMDGGVE